MNNEVKSLKSQCAQGILSFQDFEAASVSSERYKIILEKWKCKAVGENEKEIRQAKKVEV